MVGNISSAAQSISKGLTRLQSPEVLMGKVQIFLQKQLVRKLNKMEPRHPAQTTQGLVHDLHLRLDV